MFEDLRECFEREHVQMKKVCGFLVDSALQAALSFGLRGKIADAPRGDVVLSKGIHEPLSHFCRFSELCWGW